MGRGEFNSACVRKSSRASMFGLGGLGIGAVPSRAQSTAGEACSDSSGVRRRPAADPASPMSDVWLWERSPRYVVHCVNCACAHMHTCGPTYASGSASSPRFHLLAGLCRASHSLLHCATEPAFACSPDVLATVLAILAVLTPQQQRSSAPLRCPLARPRRSIHDTSQNGTQRKRP